MAIAYIGIGSNIGKREKNIRTAIEIIGRNSKIVSQSRLYETEPVGYEDQGWFLNGAFSIDTNAPPEQLLSYIQDAEKELKRVRTVRDGPRTIDLDILFYDQRVIKTKGLTIPHARMHRRLFVLQPLSDIAPDFVHPVLNKSITELVLALGGSNEKVYLFK